MSGRNIGGNIFAVNYFGTIYRKERFVLID